MPRKHRDCRGKIRHSDRAAAVEHREDLVRNRFAFRDTMRIYECDHCDFWHVGHRRGVNGPTRRKKKPIR